MNPNATIPKGVNIYKVHAKTLQDSYHIAQKDIRAYVRIFDEDSEIAWFIHQGIEYTVSTADVIFDHE